MSETSDGTPTQELFVRRSTGLVREASAIDAAIFNAVFSAPVGATLAWGVFFALAVFPGSDLVTATLIAFVLNIPVLIMMSLLAASMPRTGGDYVWVSRILSPPLAVVSNFDGRLRVILERLGVTQFFSHIFLSSELGADKPDPLIYERALKLSGLAPNETLHVGDDPVRDWQGAKAAGLSLFRLERRRNSLRDLLALV